MLNSRGSARAANGELGRCQQVVVIIMKKSHKPVFQLCPAAATERHLPLWSHCHQWFSSAPPSHSCVRMPDWHNGRESKSSAGLKPFHTKPYGCRYSLTIVDYKNQQNLFNKFDMRETRNQLCGRVDTFSFLLLFILYYWVLLRGSHVFSHNGAQVWTQVSTWHKIQDYCNSSL